MSDTVFVLYILSHVMFSGGMIGSGIKAAHEALRALDSVRVVNGKVVA